MKARSMIGTFAGVPCVNTPAVSEMLGGVPLTVAFIVERLNIVPHHVALSEPENEQTYWRVTDVPLIGLRLSGRLIEHAGKALEHLSADFVRQGSVDESSAMRIIRRN